MSARRSLAETIIDVADGAIALAEDHPLGAAGLRPTGFSVALPVEIRLAPGGDLWADLPQFVTRTAFDRPPARLALAISIAAPLHDAPASAGDGREAAP